MTSEADIYNSVQTPQGKWLKLTDGQEQRIRIVSDTNHAIIYEQEFTDKKTGEIKMNQRFAYVVWNHDAKLPQIWAISPPTYDIIKRLVGNPEYGDITQYDVMVKREGEQLQTKYYLTPGRNNYSLKAEQLAACEKLNLRENIENSENTSSVMTLKEFHDLKNSAAGKKSPKAADNDEPLPPDPGTTTDDDQPPEF